MTVSTVIGQSQNTLYKLYYRRNYTAAHLSVLSKIFARRRFPLILGANSSVTDAGRFSYWAAEPRDIFEFRSHQIQPFEKLQKKLSQYHIQKYDGSNLPYGIFTGGWAGFFSYELSRFIEKLPKTTNDDMQTPLIRLCFYDSVIAYDHLEKCFRLFVLDIHGDSKSPEHKFTELEYIIHKSQSIIESKPSISEADRRYPETIKSNMSRDEYFQAVEKIKRYIYDGDVYQINFSHRFEMPFDAAPIDLFNWQNIHNPSPYSAYIDAGDFQIVSASPELFIKITDGIISTKPIKGTRPRTGKTQDNNAYYKELLNSEKEQAELNMIIDLERNDIAKICVPGTRTVTQPRTIESYPTVYHAVATISGRLRDDTTICDILKAVFPGGSITGAPKIRSMEIIDELEPTARGVYTGSIGYIGMNGNTCLNIAIRTIIIKNKIAYVQTGGGIVADSKPTEEWQETLTKAKALLEGINSVQRAACSRQRPADSI